MSFLSYGKQWIGDDEINAVVEVLKSDFLTQGPIVKQFENKISKLTGAKYTVAVSNGTAALHIAVAALEIKGEAEGITSPNTFLASSNALIYNNIKPVFADIDPLTYNICPKEIEKKLTKKTKVVIPVHFAGQPVFIEKISQTAKKNNCYIIEDAAHALGSCYKNGDVVGSCKFSDMTIFSFHPVKTVTTGEGGAITTNDKLLYERLLRLRNHGMTKDHSCFKGDAKEYDAPWYYEMITLGFNYTFRG